jgi:uncharacterized membrane protein HdeD (DUF308 family)
MSTLMGYDIEGTLRAVGRAWGWILAFGILSILVGLVAIVWPNATLVAIAIIFAIQLVLGGVFRFVGAFAVPLESGWLRALQALLAILSFVIGIYLLGHLGLSLLVLALVLGIYWIAHGIMDLFLGIGHPELPGRAWTILSGILSIAAGVILAVWPGISLYALTLVVGIWLIVFGVIAAVRAVQIRSAAHAVSTGPVPA